MSKNYHHLSVSQVFAELDSSKKGLTKKEVLKRQKQYGPNRLPKKKPLSRLALLLNQIKSPLVYILIAAGFVSLALKHYTDAGVIFFVVAVNTFFGYWQESKANAALNKLREIVRHTAVVKRDGLKKKINASELTIGDIVFLRSGDKIPADCRLFEVKDFQTAEASLTGESAPIDKTVEKLDLGTALAERRDMVYMGTVAVSGFAKAVVCAVGANTELGKISSLLRQTPESPTPLQTQLSRFGRILTFAILFLSALVFVAGYLRGLNPAEMFLISVALAVSAVPEGLLVAVTIILTIGMRHILKRRALVRRLIAAETLGSASVICSDKTGTLTEGKMRVSKIITADREYDFGTKEYEAGSEKARDLISKISVLCSNADMENPGEELKHLKIIGDPTESALLLASIESGVDVENLRKKYKKIDEIPFSSESKFMFTLHEVKGEDKNELFAKGAPEKIFSFCDRILVEGRERKFTAHLKKELQGKYEHLTSKGLRLLGFAFKPVKSATLPPEAEKMIFLGFMALKDPLRADAKETVRLCRKAGIRPIVITGDHRLTAKAIFEELGLKTDGNMVEGKDLDKWDDNELKKRVRKIDIYARVEPRHKIRVVKAWQSLGEVVAMTGDGINDAPALKAADIGVALGSGSDVTKETADMVLLDNGFKVIVSAVEQGRVIFENIRKVILYLLSDSFSEIILISGALLLKFPLPVLATQILWINLVADGLPNIAMTLEKGEEGIMSDKPRAKNESILNREMKILIFVIGIVTDLFLLGLFAVLLRSNSDLNYIRTIIFAALGFDSLLYVFSVRSLRHSIFTRNPFDNKYLLPAVAFSFLLLIVPIYIPWVRDVFGLKVLGLAEWGIVVGLAIVKIFLIEVVKHHYIVKKRVKG